MLPERLRLVLLALIALVGAPLAALAGDWRAFGLLLTLAILLQVIGPPAGA